MIFYVLFYVLVYLKLSDCLHTNFKSKFFSNLRQPLVSKLFFHLLNFYLFLPFLLLNLPFSSFTLLLHSQSFLVQLSNFFLFLLSKSLLLTLRWLIHHHVNKSLSVHSFSLNWLGNSFDMTVYKLHYVFAKQLDNFILCCLELFICQTFLILSFSFKNQNSLKCRGLKFCAF